MSPILASRPAEILIAEDVQGDFVLAQEGFKRLGLPTRLHHVENGEECLAFLKKEGRYQDAPTPDILLLDLNMPIMGGVEVMQHLVSDPQLKFLPVVVLTTDDTEACINKMYDLRCSTYVVKPLDFEEFQTVIQVIGTYWFTVGTLPGEQPSLRGR